jgi:hypothetical protein
VAPFTCHTTAREHPQSCHSGALRILTATTAHAPNLRAVSPSSSPTRDLSPHATSDAVPSSHPTKAPIQPVAAPSLCPPRPLLKHKQPPNANLNHHRVRPTPSPRFSREQTCIEFLRILSSLLMFIFEALRFLHGMLHHRRFLLASTNDVRAL